MAVWTEGAYPPTSGQKKQMTRQSNKNKEPWQGVPNSDSKVTFKVANHKVQNKT